MSETFFIADMHVKHKNILVLDNRPWKDIAAHDQALADNWKARVGEEDHVYVLGDTAYDTPRQAAEYYGNLPGHKHLIKGNHDAKLAKNKSFKDVWESVKDYHELKLSDRIFLVLCHYPILAFNKHYRGAYHFYGHVHNSQEATLIEECRQLLEEKMGCPCNAYNVGAMMPYINYMPRTFEEIIGGAK